MTLRTGAVSTMVAALSQDLYHLVDLFPGRIANHDPSGLAQQRHGVSFMAESGSSPIFKLSGEFTT